MQFSLLSATLLLLAPLASASEDTKPRQPAKELAMLGSPTSQGCFKSVKGLTDAKIEETKASSGECRVVCKKLDKPVFALGGGTTCYCGDTYPPKSDLTDDSDCDMGCQAYPLEACGNMDGTAFSVWNTGVKVSVPFYSDDDDDNSSSSGSASKTASGSSNTAASKTAVSTSIITNGSSTSSSVDVDSATGLATAAGSGSPSNTETAAAATSSVPSSGSKSLMGAGVAILIAAIAV